MFQTDRGFLHLSTCGFLHLSTFEFGNTVHAISSFPIVFMQSFRAKRTSFTHTYLSAIGKSVPVTFLYCDLIESEIASSVPCSKADSLD